MDQGSSAQAIILDLGFIVKLAPTFLFFLNSIFFLVCYRTVIFPALFFICLLDTYKTTPQVLLNW